MRIMGTHIDVVHDNQGNDSGDPVEDVSEDGTDEPVVGPTKDGGKDCPSAVPVLVFRVAAVKVAGVAADVVAAGTVARFSDVSADPIRKRDPKFSVNTSDDSLFLSRWD